MSSTVVNPDGGTSLPATDAVEQKVKVSVKVKDDSNLLSVKSAKKQTVPEDSARAKLQPINFTPSQIAEIKEAFKLFDKDGDGWIESRELGTVMRALGQNPTESEIADIVHECDTDDNGRLEFQEFVAMMAIFMKTPTQMEDELMQSFRMFDANNDGYISSKELKAMMSAMGEVMSSTDIDTIIKQWDSDGDGRINYNEFVKAMVGDTIFK